MSSPELAGSSSPAGSVREDESDEEMDWEEIAPHPAETLPPAEDVPNYNLEATDQPGPSGAKDVNAEAENIEITLHKVPKVDPKRKKQAEQTAEIRALRLTCHKIHTVALLANAIIRNRWLNDPLLHARLLSLAPMSLQTSFSMITKKRHPEAAKRGRLFESSMMRLTQWWYEEFFEIEKHGHVRSRTFDEVQKILFEVDFDDSEGEGMRSSKSLMKHALKRRGSRDVSSQLFTALCRALGIPARLVVSLQSVPWQASVGKEKPPQKKSTKKGKEKADVSSGELQESDAKNGNAEEGDDDDMEEVAIPSLSDGGEQEDSSVFPGEGQTLSGISTPKSKGKGKAVPRPAIKLRKSKSSGRRLGAKSNARPNPAPIGYTPPVFWTEVFSRPDGKWMSVDPTRYIVNKRKVFQPSAYDRDNRMVYVVAVEEDGYCRDVTARYARDYGSKTSKAQLGGKGRKEWWESVMALVTRPFRLIRDDVEDEEFDYIKYIEGMPTSVAGFKNHPLYVLEQHLKRDEVIFPKTEVGKFRGEPVYPRSNVIPLKTAENWMRTGRRVKEGVQPLKWVKQRAVTIHRRRAMELAQQEGDEVLQGLYSEDQTELHVPDPVVDGVVPKNEFGNIDLYTPSMLPEGAAHIPYKRVARIAKKLGFDHAEAVTGFEFKKGRAFPIVSGIVVASENEETLLEAYWEAEREAEKREEAKRRERVIKRWSRLIQGLRIRQRLQEQYAGHGQPSTSILRPEANEMPPEFDQAGGFLTEADTVVQPFHLPRFEHNTYHPDPEVGTAPERDEAYDKVLSNSTANHSAGLQSLPGVNQDTDLAEGEDDDDLEEVEVLPASIKELPALTQGVAPKSMLDLAKETEARQVEVANNGPSGNDMQSAAVAHGNGDAILIKQVNKRGTRSSEMQNSDTKTRQERDVARENTDRRRTASRKRNGTESPTSPSGISDLDGAITSDDVHDTDEGGYENARSSGRRSGSSKSGLKRKRSKQVSAVLPASSRVLRTRVPKTKQQIKAEEEAEAAFRHAITE